MVLKRVVDEQIINRLQVYLNILFEIKFVEAEDRPIL